MKKIIKVALFFLLSGFLGHNVMTAAVPRRKILLIEGEINQMKETLKNLKPKEKRGSRAQLLKNKVKTLEKERKSAIESLEKIAKKHKKIKETLIQQKVIITKNDKDIQKLQKENKIIKKQIQTKQKALFDLDIDLQKKRHIMASLLDKQAKPGQKKVNVVAKPRRGSQQVKLLEADYVKPAGSDDPLGDAAGIPQQQSFAEYMKNQREQERQQALEQAEQLKALAQQHYVQEQEREELAQKQRQQVKGKKAPKLILSQDKKEKIIDELKKLYWPTYAEVFLRQNQYNKNKYGAYLGRSEQLAKQQIITIAKNAKGKFFTRQHLESFLTEPVVDKKILKIMMILAPAIINNELALLNVKNEKPGNLLESNRFQHQGKILKQLIDQEIENVHFNVHSDVETIKDNIIEQWQKKFFNRFRIRAKDFGLNIISELQKNLNSKSFVNYLVSTFTKDVKNPQFPNLTSNKNKEDSNKIWIELRNIIQNLWNKIFKVKINDLKREEPKKSMTEKSFLAIVENVIKPMLSSLLTSNQKQNPLLSDSIFFAVLYKLDKERAKRQDLEKQKSDFLYQGALGLR